MRVKVSRYVATVFAVGALSLATLTVAAPPKLTNGLVVLVPTFDPMAPDQHIGDASAALVREFARHGIPTVLAAPEAEGTAGIATARALCAQNGATEVVVDHYHVDQSRRGGLADAIIEIPVVIASGVLQYAKTHGTVELDEVDCRGVIQRHVSGDSWRTHHGYNPDATVTDTITVATHDAVDKFTGSDTPIILRPDGMPQSVPATEPTNSPVVGQ